MSRVKAETNHILFFVMIPPDHEMQASNDNSIIGLYFR
jgi:hypothetical protein